MPPHILCWAPSASTSPLWNFNSNARTHIGVQGHIQLCKSTSCNTKLGASPQPLAVIHGVPMEQKAPSQAPLPWELPWPGLQLPASQELTPALGRVRTTPTGYLGSCRKKERMVSGVCMGSSPYHAILVHLRVLHLLNVGILIWSNLV